MASSGPVNAKPDFPEYLEVVDDALNSEDSECSVSVKRAVARVQFLTQHRLGWRMLEKKFKLCSVFDGSKNTSVATLIETLLGNLETIVQYNKGSIHKEMKKLKNFCSQTKISFSY